LMSATIIEGRRLGFKAEFRYLLIIYFPQIRISLGH